MNQTDNEIFVNFKKRVARELKRRIRKAINRARYERSYKRGPK